MSDSRAFIGCRWFVVKVPPLLLEAFRQKCRDDDTSTADVFRLYIDAYTQGRLDDFEVLAQQVDDDFSEAKLMLKHRKIDALRICCSMRKHRVSDLFSAFARAYLRGELPPETRVVRTV